MSACRTSRRNIASAIGTHQLYHLSVLVKLKYGVHIINIMVLQDETPYDRRAQREALKELESYRKEDYLKFRMIIPRYGITNMGKAEENFFKKIIRDLKREIKEGQLGSDGIYDRIIEILTSEYGPQISAEEANRLLSEEKLRPLHDMERQLEEKFGIQFTGKYWFKCTIEEVKFSTFSNVPRRDVDSAYVVVEDTYIDIAKESVFLKSNMGHRRLYYQNIASIDYDARGRLHMSNGLIINLKSAEHVQLKYVREEAVNRVMDKFEQFLNGLNTVEVQSGGSSVDDLVKLAELFEKGLITKEEYEIKKAEVMGTGTVKVSRKFCTNCGSPIDAGSNFCTNCGHKVE